MEVVPYNFEDAHLKDAIPYDFKKAKFLQPLTRGYWVTLYCIFDSERVVHFFKQCDMMENLLLAREAGFSCSSFIQKLLVTPDTHPEIFNTIEDYVHRSDFDC